MSREQACSGADEDGSHSNPAPIHICPLTQNRGKTIIKSLNLEPSISSKSFCETVHCICYYTVVLTSFVGLPVGE